MGLWWDFTHRKGMRRTVYQLIYSPKLWYRMKVVCYTVTR